jgi:hypothetical protein
MKFKSASSLSTILGASGCGSSTGVGTLTITTAGSAGKF